MIKIPKINNGNLYAKFIKLKNVFLALIPITIMGLFVLAYSTDATDVSGNITSDTTWTLANSPYVLTGNLTVNSGVTLTIEPGVEVRSNGNLTLSVAGTLSAVGTSANHIVFKHISVTTANSWGGINLYGGTTSQIEYAEVYYANVGIRISNAGTSAIIKDSLFQSNVVGISVVEQGSLTTERNTFNNQTKTPVDINPDSTVTFGTGVNADILGTSTYANTFNAIGFGYVDTQSGNCPSDICTLDQKTFAGISNIPYAMHNNYWTTATNETLVISSGVTVMSNGNLTLSVAGTLSAVGTSANHIVFKHINVTTANSWGGINLYGGTTSQIEYAEVYYANAGIRISNAGTSAIIKDSLFQSNVVGISVVEQGSLTTERNTFNNQTKTPVDINPDSTVTFGTGVNADILGASTYANAFNAIGFGYIDTQSGNCPSDICTLDQKTFAGISNIPYAMHNNYWTTATNETLVISSGVTIMSNGNFTLSVAGTLSAVGTGANHIIFKHISVTTANSWGGINLYGGTTSQIEYAEVYYANVGLRVNGTGVNVTVSDCLFESNNVGISVFEQGSLTTARNTFNKQSRTPIDMSPDAVDLSFGTDSNSDILGTGSNQNVYNGIGVGHSDNQDNSCPSDVCSFASKTFAGISNIPYVVFSGYVVFGAGDTLVVDPGVVLKFVTGSLLIQFGSSIDVNGSLNNYAYFTSIKNDYIGGDTNNDGFSTTPSAGNWTGIVLQDTASQSIDYADVSYATSGLNVNGATVVSITNSNLRFNTNGLYLSTTVSPTLTALNLENNTTWGIYNANSTIISAENLWWNDVNGPNDTDATGQCGANSTEGDNVRDTGSYPVDYCPYSTSKFRVGGVTTSATSSIDYSSATGNGEITQFDNYFVTDYGHVWSTASGPTIMSEAPIVQWKMNDNADTSTVVDAMGNYNGAFTGGGGTDNYTSAHSVTGKVNTALTFDGTNDYVSATITKPSLPITIAFWINSDSATPVGIFDSASGQTNVLRNYSAGRIEWHNASPYVTLGLAAGKWYHVVVIFEHDGTNRKITYYKNGELQTVASAVGSSTFAWTTFVIGNINGGANGRFAGDLDDFRIYDRALSAVEVKDLYNLRNGTETTNTHLGISALGDKTEIGTFASSITGLAEETTYYTRAYFTQPDGQTFYGEENSFVTSTSTPTVQTNTTTEVTAETATGNGNVLSLGGETVTNYGHVWDTEPSPILLEKAPVSHWKLNDSDTSTTVVDSVGSNTGTSTHNTSLMSSTGKVESSLIFNGSNKYIAVADNSTIDLTSGMTLSAWIYPFSFRASPYCDEIITKDSDASGSPNWGKIYSLYTCQGVARIYAYTAAGGLSATSTTTMTAGNWYHVVGTFDGTSLKFYLNGVLEATTTTASTTINTSAKRLFIGAGRLDNGDADQFWSGKIDNALVYNVALDSTEISALYNSGNGTENVLGYAGKTSLGAKTATGSFTSNLTGLLSGTTYYTRAYFTHSAGTAYYGSDDTFTTDDYITTEAATNIQSASATANGTIVEFESETASEHGHVWDTNSVPTIFGTAPVSQWKLNDNAANTTVADSVGSNTGTSTTNTSTLTSFGVIDRSLLFNGTSQYVAIADNSTLDLTTGMTLSAWVYANGFDGSPYCDEIVVKDADTSGAPAYGKVYALYECQGTVRVLIYGNNGTVYTADSTMAVENWYHLVGTFDGTSLKFYVNGVLKTTTPTASTTIKTSGKRLFIGAGRLDNGDADQYWNGRIDDVRIYNRALTNYEIHELYNNKYGTESTQGHLGMTTLGANSSTGSFTSSITGLTAGTTYYNRAYYIESDGTVFYGDPVSFTTSNENTLPSASNVSIDSGATSINLTESTTTNVTCTATVTDADGYSNIQSVKAYFYRTGVGSSATDDNNNHYTLEGDTECIPSGGSGTTENYTCTFPIWYHADPTDSGNYSLDNWTCMIIPSDLAGAGTSDSNTIEMNTLLALSATDIIDYENLDKGTNTGATNYSTVVTNTGNGTFDLQLNGDNMCNDYPTCSDSVIAVSNQQYSTTPFSYGSGSVLSATTSPVDFNLAKPTANPSNSSSSLYWGIAVPSEAIGTVHTGKNYITAITP